MTRDDALERAIEAVTVLMSTCAEYSDMETAQVAADAQRKLVARRGVAAVSRMERERGLSPKIRSVAR